jgi:DNA-binding MarR family transcriptional regulator
VIETNPCINLQVLKASHFILKTFDDAYREFGVRATQLPVLRILAENNSVSIKDIARLLESERSSMFRKLKVMEKSGWIKEASSPGKEKNYQLTDDGRKLVEQMEKVRLKVQDDLLSRLSAEEQSLLISLCGKMQAA